jgi:hypothetical protein
LNDARLLHFQEERQVQRQAAPKHVLEGKLEGRDGWAENCVEEIAR